MKYCGQDSKQPFISLISTSLFVFYLLSFPFFFEDFLLSDSEPDSEELKLITHYPLFMQLKHK